MSMRELFARARGVFNKHHADAELQEEMLAHLEMETEDNMRRGMSEREARRQAMLKAGGLLSATDAVHDQQGLPWVENVVADIRYAARSLRKSPAFTLVAVITLALGIGANTAIFSVVRGVLLKPLPHRDGERLVYVRHSTNESRGQDIQFSVPEVKDMRAGVPSLSGVAEYSPFTLIMRVPDVTRRIDVGLVTGNFFDVMGLSPILGRVTTPRDDGAGVPPVMVLTWEMWQNGFGGDSSVIGRQIRLEAKTATIIGVLQRAPYFPDRVDAFLNMVISDHHTGAMMAQDRTHRMTEVIARVAAGSTIEQARREMDVTNTRMMRDHREGYSAGSRYAIELIPFRKAIGQDARMPLWILMGAAAFVLIISAANVVNLTLMRGIRREHELVVRAALGAGAARLRRMLLIENLLLTLSGAAVGIVIALGATRLLITFAQRYSPRANEINLDLVVLLFTTGLSCALALLLSYAASLPREGMFASWISAAGKRISGDTRRHRLQRVLVVAQVAVSVILLAGAGLLTRTMIRLSAVSTGLRTEQVLGMSVPLMNLTRMDPSQDTKNKQLYDQMRDELSRMQGVRAVGIGSTVPLRKSIMDFDIKTEGRPAVTGEPTPHADYRTADPNYFDASGIPLLHGRAFSASDRNGSDKVAIINQRLADKLFPGGNAIGKRIGLEGEVLRFTPFTGDWRTVVGVVGNTQDGGLDAEPRAVMFVPFAQEMAVVGGLVVRSDDNVQNLARDAQRIVRRIAPSAPIEDVMTVRQIKDESVAPRRLNAELISSFGILAALIAAIGIGGVLGFSVSARTSEIGIRMSIGADSGRVQRMILREGGQLVIAGVLLGGVGAYIGSRLIAGMLFDVPPHDPATFISVVALMAVIGIAACWLPAVRAARVDPAVTMRT